MSDRSKKIFVILSVAVPFLLYSAYYYGMMIKNAPYKFSEFDSVVFEYGKGDSLVNKYNSKTGEYQYIDRANKLVKTHLKLSQDQLRYLHHKAADLGFWNFPSREVNDSLKNAPVKPPRYLMQFNYKRKSKTVLFDEAFDGDPKLKDANERMIKEIEKVIDEADMQQNSN
jgi:hypothetical protein